MRCERTHVRPVVPLACVEYGAMTSCSLVSRLRQYHTASRCFSHFADNYPQALRMTASHPTYRMSMSALGWERSSDGFRTSCSLGP